MSIAAGEWFRSNVPLVERLSRFVCRSSRTSAKQPVSSVMCTFLAPISAIVSNAIRKSLSSSSSWKRMNGGGSPSPK